jgi:hypothetical protein
MTLKWLAVLGLSLPLLAAAPALAQVGSKNACDALAKSNPQAHAQLCGPAQADGQDDYDTVLGGGDAEEIEPPRCGSLVPKYFPAGARVLVAC